MSVNKVILLGRLGQDPEIKYTPKGEAVCNFSMATSESWNDKQTGQKQEKTEWHKVVVWGKLAEICNQYIHKGSQVFVEGKLQTRNWEDNNGVKRYTTEILANSVQFLSASGSEGNESSRSKENANPRPRNTDEFDLSGVPAFSEEDIPF